MTESVPAVEPDRYWCEYAFVGNSVERSVAIDVIDGRIASVDVGVEPSPDAARLTGFTLPGLANSHSHAFHRALRSRTQADRGTFWTWRELMYRAAERLDPDRYFRLARATFAEMALAGVSCVGEFHYVHHQVDGTPYENPNEMGDALLAAASEAGIRMTLLDTLYLRGGLTEHGYSDPSAAQLRFSDGTAEAWVSRVSSLPPSTDAPGSNRIGAAIHSIRAVDPDAAQLLARWAESHDAPLHAHVSEQSAENEVCEAYFGQTPIEVLASAGVLNSRFTAVHATHLTEGDIEALGRADATVCMCPTTERDLGDGIGPTRDFAGSGIAMSLGSDSHAVIDLFEDARALEMNERLRSTSRGAHTADELLAMATVNGHRCLGWDDAGSIAMGQRADLVTIDLGSVRTAGASPEQAVEAAMFAATAADVTTVIVDGRQIVADGQHRSIDVARELDLSIGELMDA